MLTKVHILIAALFFPLSANAQSDDQFLESFRADFPKSCAKTAPQWGVYGEDAVKLCRCTTDGMINAFSVPELKQMTERATVTDLQRQQITTIGQDCVHSHGIVRQTPTIAAVPDRPNGEYIAGYVAGRVLVFLMVAYVAWWTIRRLGAVKK